MSSAEYSCESLDHARILIYVDSGAAIGEAEFDEAFAVLNKYQVLHVSDAGRNIHFKFQRRTPDGHGNEEDWGSFQLHRRPHGLIILAECSTAIDVALLHEVYQTKKQRSTTIFDSRCFVFGIDNALLQHSQPGMLQYPSLQDWISSENDIKDFLTSLFYVLESKRRQYTSEKHDKSMRLLLPYEMSAPSDKKKSIGRWKKHLGDINLLCGMYAEALHLYQVSEELLDANNDSVMMAAAIEGLCVTSAIIIWPENSSNITPIPKIKSSESLNLQQLDARNLKSSSQQPPPPTLKEVIKLCLQTPEEFINKYKEAVIIYSKEKHLAPVELESCIKATKTMAIMKKFKEAADFLQNAVYINLQVRDDQRVDRYKSLADLYARIGMRRKSSFYSRVAAMQCVSANLPIHQWKTCCQLLQSSLPGFGIDLLNDSGLPLTGREAGWSLIKLRILHEFAYAARKLGDDDTAGRIMIFALMRLHEHMTENDEKDICKFLENLTVNKDTAASCKSTSQKFVDVKGYDHNILPQVHFYSIPTLQNIEALPLEDEDKPRSIREASNSNGVFLFTPSTYYRRNNSNNKIEFKWVVGENALIRVSISNPLKHCSLKVKNFRVIGEMESCNKTTGPTFECDYHAFELPPLSSIVKELIVMPLHFGLLTITGYEARVYGVDSTCIFKNMSWINDEKLQIQIIPPLPQVKHVESSLSRNEGELVIKSTVLPGEIKLLQIPLHNVGKFPANIIDVSSQNYTQSQNDNKFPRSTKKKDLIKETWLQVTCDELHTGGDDIIGEVLHVNEKKFVTLRLSAASASAHGSDDSVLSSVVKIRLCTNESFEKNWCRHLIITLETTLTSHLKVHDILVTNTNRQGWCQLQIDIENTLNEQICVVSKYLNRHNLLLSDGRDVLYEDGNIVLLHVEPHERTTCSHVIKCVEESSNIFKEFKIHKNIFKFLNQLLLLEWKIDTKDYQRKGSLDLTSFRHCKPTKVMNIIKPPMKWDLKINSNVQQVDEFSAEMIVTGEFCNLQYTITNVSSDQIGKMEIELQVFQDQFNGMCEYNMEDSVVILGTSSADFYHVKSGETCEFVCCLLFLLVGQYQIRVRRVSDIMQETEETANAEGGFHQFSPILTVNVQSNC